MVNYYTILSSEVFCNGKKSDYMYYFPQRDIIPEKIM